MGKLNGLGWEKEVEYLERIGCSDLTHFSGVRQAKPLTERSKSNILFCLNYNVLTSLSLADNAARSRGENGRS